MVFKRLQSYGIAINPAKCVFGVKQLIFLGHSINREGFRPIAEITFIAGHYPPKKGSKIPRLFNFYYKFIDNLAILQAPLLALTSTIKRRDSTDSDRLGKLLKHLGEYCSFGTSRA